MTDQEHARSDIENLGQRAQVLPVYQEWKCRWCIAEESERASIGKPMIPLQGIAPWQVWRADPRGMEPIINGQRPSSDDIYPKITTTEEDPLKRVRYRPGLIVSGERVLTQGRAWICYTTGERRSTQTGHLEAWEVQVGTKGDGVFSKSTYCHTPFLRSVSADLSCDCTDRELLAWEGRVSNPVREQVRRVLQDVIDEKFPSAAPVRAGCIARFASGPGDAAFDAFVVATCSVRHATVGRGPVQHDVILACRLVRYDRAAVQGMEDALGLLPINEEMCPFYRRLKVWPAAIDTTLPRPVLRERLGTPFGVLDDLPDGEEAYLAKARRILKELLA